MKKDTTRRIQALEELRDEFVRVARAESRPSPGRRQRLIAGTLAALVLLAGGAAASITIGSNAERVAPPQAERTAPGGTARPPGAAGFTRYQTLGEIVANSDLVVVGTVREVAPGYVEPSEDGFPTRYLNAVLEVDETWKGTPGETITVVTNELAYGNPGGGSEWREPGVRVVAFLSPGDSGPSDVFYPTDEQGIFVLRGDTLVPTVSGATSLSGRIAAMSVQELGQAVQEAAQAE